jgi:hypothetical protein
LHLVDRMTDRFMFSTTAFLLFAGACAALGCEHGQGRAVGTTTTTGALTLPSEDAVDRIVSTRCDREFACDNVGAGRRFYNRQECYDHLGEDARGGIRAAECPTGVPQPALDRCLRDIQSEPCGKPAATLAQTASCRKSALCVQ